jgi:4-hydroxy-tetrahydrodipicolinate synthase
MRPPFVGSAVALVTPFRGDDVDVEALRALVRFHLAEGTDALVVNGSTGEAAAMTPEEQRRALEVVAEEVAGRRPVIAGVGGTDTRAVARLAAQARAAGADLLLISAPPYSKPQQRGLVAHFRAVIDAGDRPTVLYNVPGRTACNLLPETVAELAEVDARVVGIKEASGDVVQVAEIARLLGERIAIYSGNDDQILPILALGGVGVVSVVANVAPRETSRLVHAFRDGQWAEARMLQLKLLPLIRALFLESNPVPVKAALALLGFPVGEVRPPLAPASEATRARLREELMALGRPVTAAA